MNWLGFKRSVQIRRDYRWNAPTSRDGRVLAVTRCYPGVAYRSPGVGASGLSTQDWQFSHTWPPKGVIRLPSKGELPSAKPNSTIARLSLTADTLCVPVRGSGI